MTTPTITLYPDTLPAKGQANAPFDVNVDNFLTWQTVTNGPELAAMITWTQGVADTVLATALAGNLPALTGKAGQFIRANTAEDGGEFVALPELTQVQVEDDTDTTFGLVSGVRLGQAVAALAPTPSTTAGAVGTYVYGTTVNSESQQPQFIFGTTYAGSGLYPAGLGGVEARVFSTSVVYDNTQYMGMKDPAVAALSGTWRCMGQTPQLVAFGADEMPVTLFVRIS